MSSGTAQVEVVSQVGPGRPARAAVVVMDSTGRVWAAELDGQAGEVSVAYDDDGQAADVAGVLRAVCDAGDAGLVRLSVSGRPAPGSGQPVVAVRELSAWPHLQSVDRPWSEQVFRCITCTVCLRTSWHPDDVANGFCGDCESFTFGDVMAVQETTVLNVPLSPAQLAAASAGLAQTIAVPAGGVGPVRVVVRRRTPHRARAAGPTDQARFLAAIRLATARLLAVGGGVSEAMQAVRSGSS